MMKIWTDRESLRWFAILEISKRGKVGIVMTGPSKRMLMRPLTSCIISARGRRSYEIIELFESKVVGDGDAPRS